MEKKEFKNLIEKLDRAGYVKKESNCDNICLKFYIEDKVVDRKKEIYFTKSGLGFFSQYEYRYRLNNIEIRNFSFFQKIKLNKMFERKKNLYFLRQERKELRSILRGK
jgi:hypothetical protein